MSTLENHTEVVPAVPVDSTQIVEAVEDPAKVASPTTAIAGTTHRHTEFDTLSTVRNDSHRLVYALVGWTLGVVIALYSTALLLNHIGGGQPIKMSTIRDAITVSLVLTYVVILTRARRWKWVALALAVFVGLIGWHFA